MILEQVTETLFDTLETAVCTWRLYRRFVYGMAVLGMFIVLAFLYCLGRFGRVWEYVVN